jgi:GNAT superfamily N-acetyltransferase
MGHAAKPEDAGDGVTLVATPVLDARDVEIIRLIRKETREGYSAFNDEITADQQQAWWNANRDHLWAWTYSLPKQPDAIVGFGLLRQDDDGYWLTTVGVLPECTGHGYGKEITHDIVMRAPGRCRATARKDNPAAVKLHVSDDWDIVDGPDERLVYFVGKRDPGKLPEEAVEQWAEHGWVTT